MDWDSSGDNKNPKALILEGLRLFREDQLSNAMDTWKEAIAGDPFNPEALFYLKEAFKEKDRTRIVANLLGTSLQNFKRKDFKQTLIRALMVRAIDAENLQAMKLALMAGDGLLDTLKPLSAYDRLAEEKLAAGSTDANPFRSKRGSAGLGENGELSVLAAKKATEEQDWARAYAILALLGGEDAEDPEVAEIWAFVHSQYVKALEAEFPNLSLIPTRTGKDLFDSDLKDWDIEEMYVFSLINGKRPIGQILNLVSHGKEKALPALHQFQTSGLITLVEPKSK